MVSPFTPLRRGDGPDVERTSAPGNDPAVTEWRAALGQSTSAQLRQTQAALAASQADLTAAKAENADWRATAERYLAAQEELARELATARYQNRILTAENEAALRRLNEMGKP
jgi:hypothetical protein